MANVFCIMGESGSGKTTSARTLDYKSTVYVDCDKKGLSWKGWKKQYCKENKNFLQSSDIGLIRSVLGKVHTEQLQIKTVIIDTINGIMIDDEMSRRKEKGFDKWMDLAASVYELIRDSHSLRDDLTIFFIAHIQDDFDECGNHHYSILTNGKKLQKIKLESKFSTVLFSKVIEGKYIFETQSKQSTAKSPMGMFETFEVPNDLNFVISKINEFNS